MEYRRLGISDLSVSAVCLGTMTYGQQNSEAEAHAQLDLALARGINFIDTAEMYGRGRSERLVGQFMAETPAARAQVVLATKFAPLPWRLSPGRLLHALRESLNRLGLSRVDLYQIHFPYTPVAIETWMNALADAVEADLTRAVGVSNFSPSQTIRAHAALARRGVPLASNQVEYSLLEREPEASGLVKVCADLGVTVIAYSPIAKGMLTGKYTPDNIPPGMRRRMYNRDYLIKIQPLIDVLREIGQTHSDKSPSQVSLNWLICKGAVPIPGAKNLRQAQENFGAVGWRLTDDEVARLDETSKRVMSNE